MASSITAVYVKSENEEELFIEAQLISEDGDSYNVRLPNGEEMSVPQKDCLPAPALGAKGQPDMIFLEHLNEAALMQNLRVRLFTDQIYTVRLSAESSLIP